jgi:hypothetical protein
MEAYPTMQEIAGWLGQVRVPAVSVGAIGERRIDLTVGGTLEMTVEAAGDSLTVSSDCELPGEIQGVLDMPRLEEVAGSAARSSALPMSAAAREAGAGQRVAFAVPLFLDGLTRNELASAVWGVWNVHDLLVRQIMGYKQIEAISAEMKALQEKEAEPVEAAAEAVQAEEAVPVVAEETLLTVAPPDPDAEAAVVAEQSDATSDVFCRNCGQKMRPAARFCKACGANLEG